ncbi:hypothetical protein DXA57_09510 [Blautia sp. OF03-15BH]|nr:hypothetical protein DXA57_09510 [Blautia sp. OF03-15BH]
MVMKLDGFYSFRFYGILPCDGFFLSHHVIPMSTTSKKTRRGCVWDPCVRRQETAGFLFLQTKTIREDPEKERSSSWRSFCMFPPAVNAPSPEKVNKNGHLWDNPVE